jgi:23S rRNA (uracil1939-C5)-methyltransferase
VESNHELVQVRLTGLAGAGRSIGVVEEAADPSLIGIKSFVTGALPGDVVRAVMDAHKGNFIEASVDELLVSSPHRRVAPCPVVSECGGCDLQQLSYEQQLISKREMIIGAFRAARLGGEDDAERNTLIKPFIPSQEGGYRRRFSFHIDRSGAVGLYRRGSRSVLPLAECYVATSEVNRVLEKLPSIAAILAVIPATAIVESGKDEAGVVLVFAESIAPQLIDQLTLALPSIARVWAIRVREELVRSSSDGEFALEVGGRETQLPLGSFSQVNWEVNRKLVERVVSLIGEQEAKSVLDLYAGAGNFAIPIASRGIKTTAVELVPELVAAAQDLIAREGLPISYRCMSVEKYLREIRDTRTSAPEWDCLVVDPPRSGLGKLISSLPTSPLILLVSCQLASCIRDLKAFVSLGYRIESVEPFDMFAQTSHTEILSVLRR